ncbi:hypothetical protein B0H66DRAFT_119680 [Apodospora peruviana]|uniref:Apple domain-containing protein n=1 Tax=Apodospora peruviana TaxID=516989 RepID=A0AAE0IIH6_9PEZI|nr:hypothetical protein B0H66DRAFT_119680 [Apodospora peruviana]
MFSKMITMTCLFLATLAAARDVRLRSTSTVCTSGLPAAKQHPQYPINDFTYVAPRTNWTSYSIDQDWYKQHFVSGPHYISVSQGSDPYGAFKCQYTCNAADNCNSYFVYYENVGKSDEHLNCVLFDAIIEPSAFVPSSGTMGAGGYDRLC